MVDAFKSKVLGFIGLNDLQDVLANDDVYTQKLHDLWNRYVGEDWFKYYDNPIYKRIIFADDPALKIIYQSTPAERLVELDGLSGSTGFVLNIPKSFHNIKLHPTSSGRLNFLEHTNLHYDSPENRSNLWAHLLYRWSGITIELAIRIRTQTTLKNHLKLLVSPPEDRLLSLYEFESLTDSFVKITNNKNFYSGFIKLEELQTLFNKLELPLPQAYFPVVEKKIPLGYYIKTLLIFLAMKCPPWLILIMPLFAQGLVGSSNLKGKVQR